MLAFSLDHRLSVPEALVLLALIVVHVVLAARSSHAPADAAPADPAQPAPEATDPEAADPKDPAPDADSTASVRTGIAVAFVALGVAALVSGAEVLVRGATTIATELGISDVVVGLTVVAIGTSLPELATSVIAVRRGETDMAIGNIVGSNIVNIGLVLGVPTLIAGSAGLPISLGLTRFDIPVMVAAIIFLFPVVWPSLRVTRWEGVVLLGLYALYLANLVIAAARADQLSARGVSVLIIVAVLAGLTLMALTALAWHRRRRARPGVG